MTAPAPQSQQRGVEPVAWRIATPTGYIRDIFDNEAEATREADGYWKGAVEPLYAAPASGDVRAAVIEELALDFENSVHHVWDNQEVADRIRSLATGDQHG